MIRLNLQQFGKGGGSGMGGHGSGSAGSSAKNSQGEKKEPEKKTAIDYTTPVAKLEKGGVYDVKQVKGTITKDYSSGDTYADLKELLKSYTYDKKTRTWRSKVRKDIQYIITRHSPNPGRR